MIENTYQNRATSHQTIITMVITIISASIFILASISSQLTGTLADPESGSCRFTYESDMCNYSLMVPHPVDPAKYLQCISGIEFIKKCPDGLKFIEKIQGCDAVGQGPML